MASLGISSSTFRRLSQEYEAVFSPLIRDANNRRVWTLEAAGRAMAAYQALRDGGAESIRAALEAVRDGRALSVRPELPTHPGAGRALEALSIQVQQQGQGISELLRGLDTRDAELTAALRALAAAQADQARTLETLRVQIHASAHPAPSQRPGLLVRLFLALLGR
jgi:hypothetical protein